ncbi:hypothetical protein NDU88_000710 [Pleurodeles waltl]|uniref:Uncharacterized protein n=1 Tax=Pleurodeles waltl TaxID=8319 RepID=A0AAV7M380_PLEWA|nr:hypothetical protein NDU88_000710 [Pleurodeles waltl]
MIVREQQELVEKLETVDVIVADEAAVYVDGDDLFDTGIELPLAEVCTLLLLVRICPFNFERDKGNPKLDSEALEVEMDLDSDEYFQVN